MVRVLSGLFFLTGRVAMESGKGLRNRGLDSQVDSRVERKITRRIRKHATQQLGSQAETDDDKPETDDDKPAAAGDRSY